MPAFRGRWPTPTSARNEHSSWSTPSFEAEVAQTTGGPQARASWWGRGTFSLGCTILTRVPPNPQCQRSPHVRLRSSRLQVTRGCAHPVTGSTNSAGGRPHQTRPCHRLPHPETHSAGQTPENTSRPGARWRCGGTAGALGGLGHRLSPDQGPAGGGVCRAVLCTSCWPLPNLPVWTGVGWGGPVPLHPAAPLAPCMESPPGLIQAPPSPGSEPR